MSLTYGIMMFYRFLISITYLFYCVILKSDTIKQRSKHMAANKLINFRCPDDLLTAISEYGREHYPSAPNNRGSIDYDQSKALRDILISGVETLTGVKLEKEPAKTKQSKLDIDALLDRIAKLESQVNLISKNR